MADVLAFKAPVRLATTANIALTGEQSIDSVTTSGNRVLVKNQNDTTQNGIYLSSSGPWQRTTDFDGPADFTSGSLVYVTAGSANAGTAWACAVSTDPPSVGSSAITWTPYNPNAGISGDLTAIEALSGTGIARRTGADTWTLGALVTNAELDDMAQATIKGRAAGAGTGDATDLTPAEATAILDVFGADAGGGGVKGLVPATVAGDAGKFLKGDGTWAANGGGDLISTNNLTDLDDAATAFGNIKQTASDTASGVVELATDAEAESLTPSTTLVPSVASMQAAIKDRTESIIVAVTDESAIVTQGTNKTTFRMPCAMTLTEVRASLTTAQTSGSILTVNIKETGGSIFTTKLTIDNNEKSTGALASPAAATPAVISDTALADDAEITIDVDQVGNGTAAGLKVYLIGIRT